MNAAEQQNINPKSEDFRADVLRSLDWRIPATELQDPSLYQKITRLVEGSDAYALLFKDRAVAELTEKCVTDGSKEPISPMVMQLFLNNIIESGYLYAFEHTPLPGAPLRDDISSDDISEIASIRALSQSAKVRKPEERSFHCFSKIYRKFGQYAERSMEEKIAFNKSLLAALTGENKAYELFSDAGFRYHDWMPGIVEWLALQKKEGIDSLLQEVKTQQPQRGNYLQGKAVGEELHPVFAVDPYKREFFHEGQKYEAEMERSMIGTINILCEREQRDNQCLEYREGVEAVVEGLSNPGEQFLAVYKINAQTRDYVGAVWLDGLRYKDENKIEHYDEIESSNHPKILSAIRRPVSPLVEQFAVQCGYVGVIFDSDRLIRGGGK